MTCLNNDNWGHRARIGLFIVSSEAVPEAEWQAMAPPGVSVHAARVEASNPWATWGEGHTSVDLAADLARGCRHFAAMRLSAVVIAHTSSSVLGGKGWDEAVTAEMRTILGEGPYITTNGNDTVAGLRTVGAKRPFIVVPAWFSDAAITAAVRYYEDHGFEPAGHLRYDPGESWRHIPPQDLYANGMGFAQEVEPLYHQIVEATPPDADVVFIAGTGFRCVAIIEALETTLGRPVVTANQASLWRCLRSAGISDAIPHYGRLLSLRSLYGLTAKSS
jgi:maleate isomerase